MPITYHYDPETKIMHTRCAGVISVEATEEYVNALWSDDKIPYGIVDVISMDEVEDFAESKDDVWKYREMFARVADKRKYIASVLVATTPLHIGFARMFQSIIQEEGADWIMIANSEEEIKPTSPITGWIVCERSWL